MSRALPIRIAIVLALALPGLGAGAASALTASVATSRTSGIAPLAVFFDGRGSSDTGTSASNMFLGAVYSWNFGDTPCVSGGDVWAYSGKSKCSDMGPVAGHVYETPGTYTATLTVRHGGQVATRSVTITVRNPNQVFSGTATTCVSTSADFSGCPSGAVHVTSSADFSQILATYAHDGKRVLFHRGQSWRNSGTFSPLGNSGTEIGAFGTGAKPAISTSSHTFGGSSSGSNLTVMDLSVKGDGSANTTLLNCNYSTGPCRFLTLLRVDASTMYITWGGDTKNFSYGTSNFNYGVSMVDGSSRNRISHSAANDMYWCGTDTIFMGNESGQEQGEEHDLRIPFADGMVISHNLLDFTGPNNKALIKMHNKLDGSPCTQGVEVADNTFDGGPNGPTGLIAFAPQDKSHPSECVEDVRIERNYLKTGTNGYKFVYASGYHFLIADNILNMTNARSGVYPQGILIDVAASGMPTPTDFRVYNNTCYEGGATSNAINCVRLNGGITNSIVRNNLVWTPGLSGSIALQDNTGGGTTTASNNLVTTSNPFSQAQLTLPLDFKLSPSSAAVNAGSNAVPTTGADFSGLPGSRLSGASVDAGAWELQSSGGTASAAPSAPILLP